MGRIRYHYSYLSEDMRNTGFLFEYIRDICKNIDIEWFISSFMRSFVRSEIDKGHPRFLTEAAEDVFDHFIQLDLKEDRSKIKYREDNKEEYYRKNELYWIGCMYVYIQYTENISSKRVYERYPFDDMRQFYRVGHEMDITVIHGKMKASKRVKKVKDSDFV